MFFYSRSAAGFFTPAIHGDSIPVDAVQITDEAHAELINAQASGSLIVSNDDGFPILQEPPLPTGEALRALAVVDIERRRDEGLVAGVSLGGQQFHSDDRFLVELLGMIMGYQAGVYSGTQSIRTRDNQIVQLDAAGITALAATVGAHRKAVYANSWAEKDAL